MANLRLPAFDPADLPESNASQLPEPFKAGNAGRWYRRMAAFAGLTHFGVNLARIAPGGQSSYRHAHSAQDEFVYVLEGDVVLETDGGEQVLSAGHAAGFPAGTGDAHRFVNRGDSDVLLLVVGDRSAGDVVSYPDTDLAGHPGPDGRLVFTHKDGSPY